MRLLLALSLLLTASVQGFANTWLWNVPAPGGVINLLPAPMNGSYLLTSLVTKFTYGTNVVEAPPSRIVVSRMNAHGGYLWVRPVPAFSTNPPMSFQMLPTLDGGVRVIGWSVGIWRWTVTRFDAEGRITHVKTNAPLDWGEPIVMASLPDGGAQVLFRDGQIRRLNALDDVVWTTELLPKAGFPISHMKVDTQGAAYLIGSHPISGILLLKIAPDGTRLWGQALSASYPPTTPYVGDLIVDLEGNPIVTGRGDVDGPFTHFVAKYDRADGRRLWCAKAGTSTQNVGLKLGTDTAGRIYHLSFLSGEAQMGNLRYPGGGGFLTRFSSDGQPEWFERSPHADHWVQMTVSARGDVRLAGGGEVRRFSAGPVVRISPVSTNALIGEPVTLTASVTGPGPFTYQWHREDQPIPAATSREYTLAPFRAVDAGNYTVTVANATDTITSDPTTLTIRPAGIAIRFYAGILVVGEVGRTYEILSKDRLNAPEWTIAATLTLTEPRQIWYDATSAGIPSRVYSFREK